jgi:predicted glycoside hydrolase/deacetylase ChbG (UPF0249 family)
MFSERKCLIVNADDFGLSAGVNVGIIEAHQRGILTSSSLMVRWPAAKDAAAYARAHPELSVGLHLDLGEWNFVNEEWQLAYEVVALDNARAVAQEITCQLEQFHYLTRRNPTHLDSHQHVHRSEPVRSLCIKQAQALGIVLRGISPEVQYCGDFYGQSDKGYPCPDGISVEGLLNVLGRLPAGCTELGCHPARAVDMEGMYRHERLVECETLCDPRVRAALVNEGIWQCSFADLSAHAYHPGKSRVVQAGF